MNLKLERPLAFFDLETTSKDVQTAKIVEIAFCIIYPVSTEFPQGNRVVGELRINPGIPIPKESSDVHGITDKDVANKPLFKEVAKELYGNLKGCDLAGFNSNKFDIPILFNALAECGYYLDLSTTRFVDVGNIFKIQEPRTLSAAYKFYCDKELNNAHAAKADILATVEVFEAQIDRYTELPTKMDDLHLFCNYGKPFVDLTGKFSLNEKDEICFTFGKHKGRTLKEVPKYDPTYFRFILDSNFPEDVKQIIRKHLKT